MTSFDDPNGQSHTSPGIENETEALRSPMPLPYRAKSRVSQPTKPPKSKRSTRSVLVQEQTVNHQSTLTPVQRFRLLVRKVIHLNKTSRYLSGKGPGAEPGIDVRKVSASLDYGHIRQSCQVEIADYSSVRSSFGRMTNREFISFLSDPTASERKRWVKVRWINVGGISWDVVRALAIKYDLHPLSLEDLLHVPGRHRSGVDYYKKHLFIRVLSHTLSKDGDEEANLLEQIVRSSSPESFELEDKVEIPPKHSVDNTPRFSGFISKLSNKLRLSHRSGTIELERDGGETPTSADYGSFYATHKQGRRVDKTVHKLMQELREGGRVNVAIKPVCIFLFKDGTVISIHPDNDLKFTEPIRRRLNQRDTGLRSTADASLLVHGLLDLVVDSALEIVDAYQRKIIDLEHQMLLTPKMTVVKQLHIISGDLILHKRTLGPIKSLVYGIRRYDVDRVAALYDSSELGGSKVEGYMSDNAKTYLADVHDHMEYILTNIEMFAGISENLINYSFNMSSHEMNEVMRILAVVTVLFAPLTVLAGYFGMNFELMWSVHGRSDILFWEIAIPMMTVTILLFFWTDFTRMAERVKKMMREKKIDKANV